MRHEKHHRALGLPCEWRLLLGKAFTCGLHGGELWELPDKELHSDTLLWGSLLDMGRYRDKVISDTGCCRVVIRRSLVWQKSNYMLGFLSISCRWCRLAKGQTLSWYKYEDETAGPWLGSCTLTKTPGRGGKGPKMDPIVIDTAITVALQLAQVSPSSMTVQCLCCPPAMCQQPGGSPGGHQGSRGPLSCS